MRAARRAGRRRRRRRRQGAGARGGVARSTPASRRRAGLLPRRFTSLRRGAVKRGVIAGDQNNPGRPARRSILARRGLALLVPEDMPSRRRSATSHNQP